MNSKERTREQLLSDLKQSEFNLSELKKAVDNHVKNAEALNAERELYSELANALPCGIYRTRVFHDVSLIGEKWASSNDAPYVIEFANDNFFKILNLDRRDFEKNPGIIIDLIFEADKAEFIKLNVEANQNVNSFMWEGRFMINGSPIWIHFESTPSILVNNDILWTGTLYDISKRKKAELEIELKNKELEKLNAEKVKFLSIVAHDLKSPFNTIIGFSDVLKEKIIEKDYELIGKFADNILQSSNRAMDLLDTLMKWAQSQTGRMEFKPEHFEMETLINEILPLYIDIAGQKSITIKQVIPHNTKVFADKPMFSTIIRNLISNAIKFTMPGGEVILSVGETQNEIVFSVQDTGVGIPLNNIGKLFQIDQSYSTSGTNHEKGTGFGLILCKEFVEKHNGKIWVESTVGIGTSFNFSLPVSI